MFDAPGDVNEYVGGYDDWLRQRPAHYSQEAKNSEKTTRPGDLDAQNSTQNTEKAPEKTEAKKPKKLSYKDQREYDALPEKIEQLETELESIHEQMNAPDFYQQEDSQSVIDRMNACEAELEAAFERWEELESQVMG